MRLNYRLLVGQLFIGLLLIAVSSLSAATVTETFNQLNASTTSTTQSGTFTGVGGVRWDYTFVRKVTGKINGTSTELDRNGRGRLTATLSGGLSRLRFKIRTIDGRWHTTAKVRVFVNGVSYGVRSPQQTDVPKTVTIDGIDIDGNVTVELQSVGSLEVIVDDVVLESTDASSPAVGANDLAIDGQGWSIVTPSPDTRKIYCSSSQGSDTNSGFSQSTPVKTLDKAFSLLRNGYPDHVYLKRGDAWVNQDFQKLGNRSGRSGKERLVVTYYGSGSRPVVRTNNTFVLNTADLFHAAIVGIEFYNYTADPQNPAFADPGKNGVKSGFRFVASFAENVLFEDCKLSYYSELLNFFYKNENRGDVFKNIDIRRNILINAYQRGSTFSKIKSQGIFVSHTEDFLLEENFFDHNGWNAALPDALANQYNHNAYFSLDNEGPMIVRGNIFSRGAAHGLQLRSGGTAEYNAFIGNAIGMNLGYKEGPPTYYTGPTVARHNVFTDGRPQLPGDLTNPQTGAIWGIYKEVISNVTVDDNIVANIQDPSGGNMKPYNEMTANEYGSGNIGWNWVKNDAPTSNPGWRDPGRDKESYVSSRSYSSYEAWVNAASNRPLRSFPGRFSARTYVDYIKQGFSVVSSTVMMTAGDQASRADERSVYIYPNPADGGRVSIESTKMLHAIRILTLDGRLVHTVERPSERTILEVSGWVPGIYVVELVHTDGRLQRKLNIN